MYVNVVQNANFMIRTIMTKTLMTKHTINMQKQTQTAVMSINKNSLNACKEHVIFGSGHRKGLITFLLVLYAAE